jgi:hypothetical protein
VARYLVCQEPRRDSLESIRGGLHTNDALDAQIGIVWPARLISEIVAGGKRDDENI